MKNLFIKNLVAALLLFISVSAQGGDANWLRYPAISPDGNEIVFSSGGDLYKVPVNGGRAMQLTANPAYDYSPVWSNDGSKIAFASNRHGNFDVFVISSNGGAPERVTFHSSDDTPTSFTPDDKNVLFNSTRLDAKNSLMFHSMAELYSVDLNGGMPVQLLSIPALNARYTSGGSLLFEEHKGREDQFRKHHTSSVTRDIWVYNPDGTFKKLSSFIGEDRNPVPVGGDEFYYLTEETGTFNVFKSSISNPEVIDQVSSFEKHPVRYLSASNDGLLCYSYNGDIYTQRGGSDPVKIDVEILSDETGIANKLLTVSGGISEMVPSPNGKEIIFIYRGEVFATSVDGSMTKRITNTPEQERSVDISPDGRTIVYASERNNSWNLYTTTLTNKKEKYFVNSTELKEEELLVSAPETFQPAFSPDGKEVAYLEERIILKVITIADKKIRTIHNGAYNYSYLDGDQTYAWSPDGKWFLIEFFPPEKYTSEIGLVGSDGKGKIVNLSKSGFSDGSPVWSADKKSVIWMSDKMGMKSKANSGGAEVDIYALFLTREAYDKYKMSEEELGLQPDDEKKDDKIKKDEDAKDKDKKAEDKKPEPVKIEFKGLTDRKVKLTVFSSEVSDALITPDGKNLLYLAKTGETYDLWKTDLVKKETEVLTKFGEKSGSFKLAEEGKSLFVLSGGTVNKVTVADGKKKAVAVSGEMRLDGKAERVYLFDHVSRQVKKKFLDKNLHGAAWDSLSINYKQFVPAVSNDIDFRDILGELLGELNASHTGARYYHANPKGDNTAAFGAFYKTGYDKDGLMIEEIIKGSPLIQAGTKIKPGVVIEKIDGQKILKGMNYYPLLNRKAGKTILLSLTDPVKDTSWTEKVKPISLGEENELRYERWIKLNRELVHKLSGNRIGYMHVRSMGDGSFREFIDKVLGEEVNKEALIVDTRFNGGGDLVDDLTTFLSGQKYQTFKWGDKVVGFESQYRWTKPSIMIVCEANYSDAHCVPAAYRDQGLGKIVGMPVPGTCSFVWWERMQNGMVFGIPNMAVIDKSGDVLENKQLEPDFIVKNEFDKIVNCTDQQIEKAVEELLKELK